jgi:hypothetical protein
VLGFTWRDLIQRPGHVVADVRSCLQDHDQPTETSLRREFLSVDHDLGPSRGLGESGAVSKRSHVSRSTHAGEEAHGRAERYADTTNSSRWRPR